MTTFMKHVVSRSAQLSRDDRFHEASCARDECRLVVDIKETVMKSVSPECSALICQYRVMQAMDS